MSVGTDAIIAYGYDLGENIDSEKADEYNHKNDKVELLIHCSCDYPMYFLSIKGTEVTAYRGTPQQITSLDVDPEWDGILISALNDLEIFDVEDAASWSIFSLWC